MLFLPPHHPSIPRLQALGIAVTDSKPTNAVRRIAILNLMPQKQEAEEEYYIAMAEANIDIEIILAKMSGLTYKTTPQEYMDTYYTDIAHIMATGEIYDGLIVTGAPLEQYAYEDVTYWQQLHEVYHWTFSHVRTTLNICWGAFASLRMFFGIDKHWTPEKLFGVYPHQKPASLTDSSCENTEAIPLMKGLPNIVMVPISRHITLEREELLVQPELTILLDQGITGPELAIAWQGRHIFANGHMEYAEGRLNFEYQRDLSKGLPITMPANYFVNDDPSQGINITWQTTGRQFYVNWLREYVCNDTLPMLPTDIKFKA